MNKLLGSVGNFAVAAFRTQAVRPTRCDSGRGCRASAGRQRAGLEKTYLPVLIVADGCKPLGYKCFRINGKSGEMEWGALALSLYAVYGADRKGVAGPPGDSRALVCPKATCAE